MLRGTQQLSGCSCGGKKEEEEKEEEAGRTRSGEGDAKRLINRHADNHSGFMVTTDYQVVQGGIFHIRDVTLFQWGNTCSARYKLHERAYTGRHVCWPLSRSRKGECARMCARARASRGFWLQGGGGRVGEEASRCPVPRARPSAVRPDPPHLGAMSQNHSHVRRLQKCPATFPRERFPDRSPTT